MRISRGRCLPRRIPSRGSETIKASAPLHRARDGGGRGQQTLAAKVLGYDHKKLCNQLERYHIEGWSTDT